MRGAARVLVACLIVLASVSAAGCTTPEDDAGPVGESGTRLPEDTAPVGNVTLAGRVTDARSGAPLPFADVRVELVTGDPCTGSSTRVAWKTWSVNVRGNGSFGPVTLPAPQGNASFQVHVDAPDHLNAARELRVEPKRNVTFDLPIALVPAGVVAFPAVPEAAASRAPVAWWVPGRAADFRAGEDATRVVTAAGPVEGVLDAGPEGLRPWTAAPDEGERVNATLGNVTRVEAAANVTVLVEGEKGAPAAGAFVLVLDARDERPLALAVADAAGRAVLVLPVNATVTAHAALPGPIVQRASGSVTTGADEPVRLDLTTPACA